MTELRQSTREALKTVATSTLTGSLHKRGLRNMFLQDVQPLRVDQARMVGIAYTMRFIPFREDMNPPKGPLKSVQPQAMEECPPGHVLVIDSRGDPRAASAGDLYIGRLVARGCSGIVTDGDFRDSEGILKIGLLTYHSRPTSPPSPIVHYPIDLDLPIGCGGVAVYPGDIIVGDCDGVVVIPANLVDEIAEEAVAQTLYDTFAEEEVARGRSLIGLFPVVGDQAKQDFEAWKRKREAAR